MKERPTPETARTEAAEKSAAIVVSEPEIRTYEQLLSWLDANGFSYYVDRYYSGYIGHQDRIEYLVISRPGYRNRHTLDLVKANPDVCHTEIVAAITRPADQQRRDGCEDCTDNGRCPVCGRMPQTP